MLDTRCLGVRSEDKAPDTDQARVPSRLRIALTQSKVYLLSDRGRPFFGERLAFPSPTLQLIPLIPRP